MSAADRREEIEAAVYEELTLAWRRAMSYVPRHSLPLSDPQQRGAVRRIMRAYDQAAADVAIAAADEGVTRRIERLVSSRTEGRARLDAADAEYHGRQP